MRLVVTLIGTFLILLLSVYYYRDHWLKSCIQGVKLIIQSVSLRGTGGRFVLDTEE